MERAAIRRGFVDLEAGQLHYAECGSRDAAAVLLLHQTPRSWREYRLVLPILGARYRAVAMDTVGFGDSSVPDWPATIESWALAARHLLDALGIGRAHVVGHHTGGVVAVELAAAFPERVDRLVLSSTPFTDAGFRRERAQRPPIDEVEPAGDGAHLAALWRKRQPFYPQRRPDLLTAFVIDALGVIDRVEEGHRAVGNYHMEDRIGRVRQPVLVVRAGADPFASPHAAALCARLANGRLVDIDGGMVPLPEQMPEAFATAVLDFLSGS